MGKVINGISVTQFIKGWWGSNDEGLRLLFQLGLPNELPFNAEQYLNTGNFTITLFNGATIGVTINKCDTYFEFTSKWPDKRFCFRLYREWDGANIDEIIKMESYAVGECTRRVLTSKSIL